MRMKKVLSLILAAIMVVGILPAMQVQAVDISTGLIAYYSFDENLAEYGMVVDCSPYGLNSPTIVNNTAAGNVLQTREGVAYFPGYSEKNGKLELGAALKLPNGFNQGVTDFTYSAWLMYDHYTDPYYNKGYTRLFDFGNLGSGGNNARDSIFARFETEENVIRIQDRGIASHGDDAASYVEYNANADLMSDWMLFTLVYKKNEETGYYETTVYLDGEEVEELSSTDKFTRSLDDLGELTDSSNGMYIGRTVWAATNQYTEDNPDFCGQMDEIRIYNTALTEAQVAYLYENTKPETGKVAFVKGYTVDAITVKEGEAPVLPESIDYTVAFNADIRTEAVEWEEIDEDKYGTVGTFAVKGTTALGDVEITVNVEADKAVVKDGLLLHYDFETDDAEPGAITDVTGNGFDAAVLNTTWSGGGGFMGWGGSNKITVSDGIARFPGFSRGGGRDGYRMGAALKLPNNVNSQLDSFTYSAWIKADSSYTYNSNMTRFFDFGNIANSDTYNSIFARHVPSSGNLYIQDRNVNGAVKETTLSEKPFTDKWGFFTFVYEYNEETKYYETKVYVNAEEVTALSTTTSFTRGLSELGVLDDSSNGMFIGRTVWAALGSNVTDNPDFCGWMDDIRLYNRGLTGEEIEKLYYKTCPLGEITVSEVALSDVTINKGQYPVLPENVKVTYNTGSTKTESVTWDEISEEALGIAGKLVVKGVLESGYEVSLNVIIIDAELSEIDEGLVAYYTFDHEGAEPDEIVDVSGNGNNAAVLNTVNNSANNILTIENGVARFPGFTTSYVWGGEQVNLGAVLKLPNGINENVTDFTYSAWIKADSGYAYNNMPTRFFDFGNIANSNTKNSIYARYTPSAALLRIQDRGLTTSSDGAAVNYTFEEDPFMDKWAFFTLTYEYNAETGYYENKVYINGEEIKELASGDIFTRGLCDLGELTDSSNGMFIGRTVWAAMNSYTDQNPDFCGWMDEIRLYNRALSEDEVMKLYSTKIPTDMYEVRSIAITEDVAVSTQYPSTNLANDKEILVSDEGAANTRYAFMRTSLTDAQIKALNKSEKILLDVRVTKVDNYGENEFYCYGLTGDNDKWVVDTITMDNYAEQLGGTIAKNGVSSVGILLDTQVAAGVNDVDFDMQWDVTDFVKAYADEGFSFLLTCGSNVMYIETSEADSGLGPEILYYQMGTPVTIERVDTEGNAIKTTIVYAVAGESYTYQVKDPIVAYNDGIYIMDEEASVLTIDNVEGGETISVVYKAADCIVEDVGVVTYVGKEPNLPAEVNVSAGRYADALDVIWDAIDPALYADKGEFVVDGTIEGTSVPVSGVVTVFPEYNGTVGSDLTITVYADGEVYEEKAVERSYGSRFTLTESYETYLGEMYALEKVEGDVSAIGDSIVLNELDQHIILYYVMKEELEGTLKVAIRADDIDGTSYTLTAEVSVLNTKTADEEIKLVIADYTDNNELVVAASESTTAKSRTGEFATITKQMAYDAVKHKNSVVYLWNGNMEPIVEEIRLADVEVMGYLPEEVYAMMPTYEAAVATIRSANDYWQTTVPYDTWTNGIHPSFWARAAYHTGNMEVYKLLGDEGYLQHSVNWANSNGWIGNPSTLAPSQWTWGYDQEYKTSSTAVLFGDWQICFQSYLDMYEFGVGDANIDRVLEVMDYQVSLTDVDSFWWWADGLYMVMPVMTKLYKLTGDEKYLDSLYKWFKYAKELMYDGPGGIPASADGYTTSAKLSSGAYYSDPDNYAYLFYRDASYVYPLKPNSGHESEKNFWARGDGWVFAGLSKVLADMPETYEHYEEFYNTYIEMAPAIIACQQTDDNGYGFWTQSMLQDYPKGTNGNNEGYETSGTAFFTYGLFWGINNGLLDEEIYLEPAIRAWGYLKNVALHQSGKVGYVQPIGSNATEATSYDTTQDFGVGAFLLAGCEAARWAQNK